MGLKNLEKLRLSVLGRQQALNFVYGSYQNQSLFDYVKNWQIFGSLEDSVLSVLKASLNKIYPQNVCSEVADQLKRVPLASTIDHHGILGHPFFLNSNLIFSQKANLKYLPVFSTAGVSLNNSSWPGCLLVTDPQTNQAHKLSFFFEKQKHWPVFSAPAITRQQTEVVLKKIENLKFLDYAAKTKLSSLVEKVFLSPKVLQAGSFSNQACHISSKMWEEVFPTAPKLVYFPIEGLVSEFIVKIACPNTDSVIYKLLFTEAGLNLLEKHFFGLKGGFGENFGSFLFWGITKQGRRAALRKNVGVIEGEELIFKLKTEDISSALSDRQIYPTSLLCFLVMLEYGFNCLGGFNQINWLTEVKEKFVLLLLEMGEGKKAERIKQIPTQNFSEGNLAFLPLGNKILKPSLPDVFLYGNSSYEYFCELAGKITVGESIDSLLPEMYKIVVPLAERQEDLLKISDIDIIETGSMKEKIST